MKTRELCTRDLAGKLHQEATNAFPLTSYKSKGPENTGRPLSTHYLGDYRGTVIWKLRDGCIRLQPQKKKVLPGKWGEPGRC